MEQRHDCTCWQLIKEEEWSSARARRSLCTLGTGVVKVWLSASICGGKLQIECDASNVWQNFATVLKIDRQQLNDSRPRAPRRRYHNGRDKSVLPTVSSDIERPILEIDVE